MYWMLIVVWDQFFSSEFLEYCKNRNDIQMITRCSHRFIVVTSWAPLTLNLCMSSLLLSSIPTTHPISLTGLKFNRSIAMANIHMCVCFFFSTKLTVFDLLWGIFFVFLYMLGLLSLDTQCAQSIFSIYIVKCIWIWKTNTFMHAHTRALDSHSLHGFVGSFSNALNTHMYKRHAISIRPKIYRMKIRNDDSQTKFIWMLILNNAG